ncbi:E3 ubiquitin-protein ligase HUWE1 [Babesia caballi]|uniref:HECT-type E3 ubiquitin transferase n=1 Tax=Babesia caballi TaxID=5871 RepID=A0AAV4M116_BABCB|nr:E3 ubiquitin-protein ligase HUWE1 [Babesia caballi]
MTIGKPRGDNYKLVFAGLPATEKEYIKLLSVCSLADLRVHLECFTQWVWEKGDVICWAPVLNRFDGIFRSYQDSYKACLKADRDAATPFYDGELLALVRAALKVSGMIVDHATSKNIYNSVDLLVSFLDDVHPDIVFLATKLLCIYFSRQRRHPTPKDAPEALARLAVLSQSPLPDVTWNVFTTRDPSTGEYAPRDSSASDAPERFDSLSCSDVIEYYVRRHQYFLTVDSYIEIGQEVARGSDASKIRIAVPDILNLHGEAGAAKPAAFPSTVEGNEKFAAAVSAWHSSLTENLDVFNHIVMTLRLLIKKYKVEDCYFAELKYKVCKVYSLYFPLMQRRFIEIRISALGAILTMNHSSYAQFLNYNPSFLLELTHFVKRHQEVELSTMSAITELMYTMVFDGIQCKTLGSLLGLNTPHGIFSKVLLHYLHHPHEKVPLPPLLRFKQPSETRVFSSMSELWAHNNPHASRDMFEEGMTNLQLNGSVVSADSYLKDWDSSARLSRERPPARITEEECRMNTLLQLLVVFYAFIMYHGCSVALTNTSVIEGFVNFIRVRDPIYLPAVLHIIQIIEALLDFNHSVSRTLRNDYKIFKLFASRMQFDMSLIELSIPLDTPGTGATVWPQGWKIPPTNDAATLRNYWMSLKDLSSRRIVLNTMLRSVSAACKAISGRADAQEFDVFSPEGAFTPMLRALFDRPHTYGLSAYSAAINLISDALSEEPTLNEELHRADVIPALMRSITEENMKSEDCLHSVPGLLCEVTLHNCGRAYMDEKKYAPLMTLVDIITRKEFVLFDRFGEVAATIGLTFDTVTRRHQKSNNLVLERFMKVMYDLLQEAKTLPPFSPQDSLQCVKDFEMYMHELRTRSPEITVDIFSTFDAAADHHFYPDRISNLAKCLTTFLRFPESLSKFIALEGLKMLYQLCSVPCLPPLSLLIYYQHPMTLLLKVIISQAPSPSVTYLHSMLQPYVLQPICYRPPKTEDELMRSLESVKMLHSIGYTLYLTHRDGSGFYERCCIGAFQVGASKQSACTMHMTISDYLRRLVTELPIMMKEFLKTTGEGDMETFFILSGKHLPHEHPELKAYKVFHRDSKNLPNSSEGSFSANDLFWSSQFVYAYSSPNAAYSGSPSPGLSNDKFKMYTEVCRLFLATSKATLYTINSSVNRCGTPLPTSVACLKDYVSKDSVALMLLCVNLLHHCPSMRNIQDGSGIWLDGMDCMNTVRYVAEAMEIAYKLFTDDRTSGGIYMLSFIIFIRMSGVTYLTQTFEYVHSVYLGCALSLALRLNPGLTAEEVLGPDFKGNAQHLLTVVDHLRPFDLRRVKYTMDVAARTVQIYLGFFGKVCNAKSTMSTGVNSNAAEYMSMPILNGPVVEHTGTVCDLMTKVVTMIGSACWDWLQLIGSAQSIAPSNSTASLHFFMSSKVIGSLLKLHGHVLDFLSEPRQRELRDYFDPSKTASGSNHHRSDVEGRPSYSRRSRRPRHSSQGSRGPYDHGDGSGRVSTLEEARAALLDMGFTDAEITRAVDYSGQTDVTALAEWLLHDQDTVIPPVSPSTNRDIVVDTTEDSPAHDGSGENTADAIRQSKLFPCESAANWANGDPWEYPKLTVFATPPSLSHSQLREDICTKFVDVLVVLATKLASSLRVIYEYVLRALTVPTTFMTKAQSTPSEDGIHGKAVEMLHFIYNSLDNICNTLSATSFPMTKEELLPVFCPVFFYTDVEKQVAYDAAVAADKPMVGLPYNVEVAKLHEQLVGLLYILVHLIGSRENIIPVLLKSIKNPIDGLLNLVEFFRKLRYESHSSGVLTFAGIGMKPSLPGIPISLPDWCMNPEPSRVPGKDSKAGNKLKAEYTMVKYGFLRNVPVPQLSCNPPFFTYAMVCISELLKKHSLIGLSNILASSIDLSENVEILSATMNAPFISESSQKKLVHASLNILECFPGSGPDLTFALLSILDTLTEVYSNVRVLLQYKRLPPQENYPTHFSRRVEFDEVVGADALSILLMIPKSGQCGGILRLISNIFLHCMENPVMLREAIEKAVLSTLSRNDFEPVPLTVFVDRVQAFTKKDPPMLLEILHKHCVLTLHESATNVDLSNVNITLRDAPRISDLLASGSTSVSPGNIPLLEASNKDRTTVADSEVLLHGMLRLIVVYMQLFCNIHGMTHITGASWDGSKPGYPFSLTISSLFYLLNMLCRNFPVPVSSTRLPKLEFDLPQKALPWKVNMVDLADSHLVLVHVIRRVLVLICALSVPHPKGSSPKDGVQESEALNKLIVSTLDRLSNSILLISSSSIKMCVSMFEEIKMLLRLLMGMSTKDCNPQFITMAVYTSCNLLHNMLQLRFVDDPQAELPAESVFQIKKCLLGMLHKFDLCKDGSTVLCSSIVRALLLLTVPPTAGYQELQDNIEGRGKRSECKDEVGSDSESLDDESLSSQEGISEADSEDIDEYMADAMDEDVEDYSSSDANEEMDSVSSDEDGGHYVSVSDGDNSDDSSEDEDLDSDESSDGDTDVEMALPHQVDENYTAVDDSDSDSRSSLDEVDNEEDEDDAPRIRVAGELDEESREEAIIDEMDATHSHLNIADDSNNDLVGGYSSSDAGDDEDRLPGTEVPSASNSIGNTNNNISINIDDPMLTLPGAGNNRIRIQIEIAGNIDSANYLDSSSSQPRMTQSVSRSAPGIYAVENYGDCNGTDFLASSGELTVPPRHPMLPSPKRPMDNSAGSNEILNLIAMGLPRVQLPKSSTPEITEAPMDEVDMSIEDPDNQEDPISSHSSCLSRAADAVASSVPISTHHGYENRHLEAIATALRVTYEDLFRLAGMDPSVIAELPEDMRDEIIMQQLNTIDPEALPMIRDYRRLYSPGQGTRQPSAHAQGGPQPILSEMHYIDSLPHRLRMEVLQAMYPSASGSTDRPESSAANALDSASSSILAALAPVLRSQLMSGNHEDLLDALGSDPLHLRSHLRTRGGSASEGQSNRNVIDVTLNSSILLPSSGDTPELPQTESSPQQPGVTVGLIIGDFPEDEVGGPGVPGAQHGRSAGASRRLGASLLRRRMEGSDSAHNHGHDMDMGGLIMLDDRGVRVGTSARNPLGASGTISRNGSGRAGVPMGSLDAISTIPNQNLESLNARFLQSLPQLLNSFHPEFLNMLQNTNRALGAVAAAGSPDHIPDSSGHIDSAPDVSNEDLVERIVSTLPRSICECSPLNAGERTKQLLDACRGAKNDFSETDIIGVCKMMYLKDEINKKLYFKLLYNLAYTDPATRNLLLRCFLYILHTSIVAMSHNSVSTIRSDAFFAKFPRLCGSRKDDFPPPRLYGISPYKHVSLDGRLDGDYGPQSSALTNSSGAGTNHPNFIDLHAESSSFVSCERVLEQLRSLLIALPGTINFFVHRVATTHSEEGSSRSDARRKRTKTTGAKPDASAQPKEIYPIDFLFMATATKLFQSSPKLMTHLLMVIQHLVVCSGDPDPPDALDTSVSVGDSSAPAFTNSAQAPSERPASTGDGATSGSGSAAQDSPAQTRVKETVYTPQQQILNNLDKEAVTVFLDIYTSWSHQSNWLQSISNGREAASNTQMQIVSKILSALYDTPKHAKTLQDFFTNRMVEIIDAICASLPSTSASDSQATEISCDAGLSDTRAFAPEVERTIGALVRIVLIIDDMFTGIEYSGQNSAALLTPEQLGKINEFYSKLDFDGLWRVLDTALINITKGATPAAIPETDGTTSAPSSNGIDNFAENPAVIEQLSALVRIAVDYASKDAREIRKLMSFVSFDYELPESNLDFVAVSRQGRVAPKKEPWEHDEPGIDISPHHLSFIYFTERHSKALNCLIKQTPSLLTSSFMAIVRLAPNCLNFDIKRHYFRQKLKEGRQGLRLDTIRINVRRDRVFTDSFRQFHAFRGDQLKGKLSVTFTGEEGVDAGGLTREWFNILATEMFNPDYGLFRREGRKQEFNHPNPLSGVNPEHLNYFKFVGRVIGKAIYDGQHIDAYFSRSFYKHMLGRKITPSDAESVDPQFYENLTSINNCRLEDLGLELFFSTEIDEFGMVKVIDLIPDGRNVPVTDENKHKYIELLCRHKVTNSIKDQLQAFMAGFKELISSELISIFDDKELELLISGIPTIDLADLRQNVEYVNYTKSSDQIVWFWEFLEGLDQNTLAAFLQFVTGTSRVPIGGFKNLMGMRGPQLISIHRAFASDRLPSAHTCFNQLDLPEYSSREKLHQKMLQAILEGKEGFGFI